MGEGSFGHNRPSRAGVPAQPRRGVQGCRRRRRESGQARIPGPSPRDVASARPMSVLEVGATRFRGG